MATEAGFGGPQFASIANELQNVALNFGAAAAAARELGAVIQTFRVLERELTLANAVAGGTAETFKEMEKQARKFALASKFSVAEVANSFYFLAAAGLDAQQAMAAASGVLILSQATMTELSRSADLVASTMASFGLAAGEALTVANLFVAAANNSLASLEKLEFAFRQVAPVAADAGLSIQETVAALDKLFDAGLRGEQAGTALRNVIVRLINPVGNAEQILQELGVTTVDVNGNLRDMFDVLEELDSKNLSQGTLAQIFGTEALAGASTLLRSAGEGSLQRHLKDIEGTQDAISLALKQMDTLDGAINRAGNALAELRLVFGTTFTDVIRQVLEGFVEFVKILQTIDPALLKTAGGAAAVGVAFYALGRAVMILSSGVGSLVSLLSDYIRGVEIGTERTNSFGKAVGRLLLVVGALVSAYSYFTNQKDFSVAERRLEGMHGPIKDIATESERVREALSSMFPEDAANGAINRFNVLNGQIKALGDSAKESKDRLAAMKVTLAEVAKLRGESDVSRRGTFLGITSVGGGKSSIAGSISDFAEGVDALGEDKEVLKRQILRLMKIGDIEQALDITKASEDSGLVRLAEDIKKFLDKNREQRDIINKMMEGEAKTAPDAFDFKLVKNLFSDDGMSAFSAVLESEIANEQRNINEFNKIRLEYEQEVSKKFPEIAKNMLTDLKNSKNSKDRVLGEVLEAQLSTDSAAIEQLFKRAQITNNGVAQFNPELFRRMLLERSLKFPEKLKTDQLAALNAAQQELEKTVVIIDSGAKAAAVQAQRLAADLALAQARQTSDFVAVYNAEVEALQIDLESDIEELRNSSETRLKEDYTQLAGFLRDDTIRAALLDGLLVEKDDSGKIINQAKLQVGKEQEFIDRIMEYIKKKHNYTGDLEGVRQAINTSIYKVLLPLVQSSELLRQKFYDSANEAAKKANAAQAQAESRLEMAELQLENEGKIAALELEAAKTRTVGAENKVSKAKAMAKLMETEKQIQQDLETAEQKFLKGEITEAEVTFERSSVARKRKIAADTYNKSLEEIANTYAVKGRSVAQDITKAKRDLEAELGRGLQIDILQAETEVNPYNFRAKLDLALLQIEDDYINAVEDFRSKLQSATINGAPQYSGSQIEALVAQRAEGLRKIADMQIEIARRENERALQDFDVQSKEWLAGVLGIVSDVSNDLAVYGAINSGGVSDILFGDAATSAKAAAIAQITLTYAERVRELTDKYDQNVIAARGNAEAIAALTQAKEQDIAKLDQARAAMIAYTDSIAFNAKIIQETSASNINAIIEANSASTDFFFGFEMGMKKLSNDMPSQFQQGVEASAILMNGLGDLFGSIFDGTAKDWKQMLASMLRDLANFIAKAVIMQAVVKPILGVLGFADGGVIGASGGGSGAGPGGIVPFVSGSAQGNVFNTFGKRLPASSMGNTMSRHPMIVDNQGRPISTILEEGPEAVLPLKRNAQGDLGVHAQISLAGTMQQSAGATQQKGGATYVIAPTFVNQFTNGDGTTTEDPSEEENKRMMQMLRNVNEGMTVRIREEISRQLRPGGIISTAAQPGF